MPCLLNDLHMKITGGRDYMVVDYLNGYSMKIYGELMTDGFLAYRSSMNRWLKPHENEEVSDDTRQQIINDILARENDKTVKIYFE